MSQMKCPFQAPMPKSIATKSRRVYIGSIQMPLHPETSKTEVCEMIATGSIQAPVFCLEILISFAVTRSIRQEHIVNWCSWSN